MRGLMVTMRGTTRAACASSPRWSTQQPNQRHLFMGGVRAKSDLVTLEKDGRVGILRLNDPKRLNPMTAAMGNALQG